ncbi:DUF2309 domain-containing protein [Nitrospira moscoviensis]|uniref:Probable inorganic carbon transporter subunit DabA n=1 Tax=Nitrospira moscoviensis TaxID=42253 RepID=A0A0K2GFM1_NITMO|nr:DUF2309 domain-containing protein [Nitrospira moscoviensis]ALA59649.1 hypothetical protein NITMOv2_3254 [Nitrospira moscoviensis]
MTRPTTERFTDTQRMELRSYVQLAGEVIAQYWPMRTFIHHNPLHGLESLPFEQAVQHGRQLFGGRGYLPNEEYRRHVAGGRIAEDDVRAALEPLAQDKSVVFGGRRLSHLDLLAASMLYGVAEDVPAASIAEADRAAADRIVSWLESAVVPGPSGAGMPSASVSGLLPAREPLGVWCDRTCGTAVVETINREMVKWCSAFLDEGEAGWSMPGREHTFYRSWKSLAQHDLTLGLLGIRDAAARLRSLPDRPEDALLEHLTAMRVPKGAWEPYLSLHLAALPGWTGYIKWRSHQTGYPWQEEFPIDVVKYLAVRLFYERELADAACRAHLALPAQDDLIQGYMDEYPHACRLRQAWVAGLLPAGMRKEVRLLMRTKTRYDHRAWEELGRRYQAAHREELSRRQRETAARALVRLARALGLDEGAIESTSPSDLRTLLDWLAAFPPHDHGPVWLNAFETSHRRRVLADLTASLAAADEAADVHDSSSRPLAQVVFCIDVRSEVFRRHLEHLGGYETLGLAGFFGVPLDYQPFSASHAVAHCPVLLKPKNQVREVPRSYHGVLAERHKTAAQVNQAARDLLHDLKENVVTPYVMVEALGWCFGLPLFFRTLVPRWYEAIRRWFGRAALPSIATTLTVEKLAREEAEEMVATEQQAVIRQVVRDRFGLSGAALSSTLLDKIRKNAVGNAEGLNGEVAKALGLTPEAEAAFYEDLRERYRISPRGISTRLDRLTHTGFSVAEQAYFVEAALRLMGLTSNFARIVLFCAHGSTSQNNPYESALDCGACGGNHGLPNARAIAAMANKLTVREILNQRGVRIPHDTQFLAAEHDTTTDTVRIVDLEDVPATHRKDLQRLLADLDEAGRHAAYERAGTLPQAAPPEPRAARRAAARRSQDWAEVRPEWGLSKNSLIVIGRRTLTQRVNLQGRSFLHSYDHQQDGSGKLLETIMTAPLVVAQWINMEHYFSTVDNEIYGSGSKVYHNVVGRVGVMTGVWSDLRIGLPAQTVLNGSAPYHEPMRLLAVIEAPRERIQGVIERHPLLDQLFNRGWVTLIALDPRDKHFYRHERGGGWTREARARGGLNHDGVDAASDEGNQDCRAGRSIEVCH